MPEHQKCYAAYTRGPCNSNEILIRTESGGNPQCVENQCPPGFVRFKNYCYQLNGEDACSDYVNLLGRPVFLVVNPTTLQLNCLDGDDKFVCAGGCCKGSQQSLGNCKPNKTST